LIFSVEEKSRRSQYEVVKERICGSRIAEPPSLCAPKRLPTVGSYGDDRDRTGDLRRAKPSLSQLSYVPIAFVAPQVRPTVNSITCPDPHVVRQETDIPPLSSREAFQAGGGHKIPHVGNDSF
jgi:hypothetical protein